MDILDMVQLVSSIAISLMGIGWSKWQVFLLSFPSSEYQESWVLKSKPHSIQCEALPREIHVLWFSSFTSDWSVSMLSGGGGLHSLLCQQQWREKTEVHSTAIPLVCYIAEEGWRRKMLHHCTAGSGEWSHTDSKRHPVTHL